MNDCGDCPVSLSQGEQYKPRKGAMLSWFTPSYKYPLKTKAVHLEVSMQSWYFIQYMNIQYYPLTINFSGDPHETF